GFRNRVGRRVVRRFRRSRTRQECPGTRGTLLLAQLARAAIAIALLLPLLTALAGLGRIATPPLDLHGHRLRAPVREALPDLSGLHRLLELELAPRRQAQLVLLALGRICHLDHFPSP